VLVFTVLNFRPQAEEATDMSTDTPALNPGNDVNDPEIPLQDGSKRFTRLSPTNRIAVVAFVLSGFLALVYEICWMRQSSLILGSTTFAVSTVLAVFLGGLALGNYFFGRISKYNRQPMRLYGLLEIGVGVLVLVSPFMLQFVDSLYASIYDSLTGNLLVLSLLRMGLISICLLPPTILMGGTLPLLCRHFVRESDGILASIGWLYALNTLGAAAGCAICGFVLIPYVGINTSIMVGGVLNILIGLLLRSLTFVEAEEYVEPEMEDEEELEDGIVEEEREDADADDGQESQDVDEGDEQEEWDEEEEEWESLSTRTVMSWLFFFTGFVALGHEVVWTRFLSLVLHNNVYTYTLTLSVILLGIVIGSWIISRGPDQSERHAFHFGMAQVASAILVFLVLMLPAGLWQLVMDPQSITAQLLIISLMMLVPAIFAGISFPLGIRLVVDVASHAGSGVGRMAAINTLGGIAGSLAVGFLMLPWIGLENTLRVTTGIGLLVGIFSWLLLEGSSPIKRRGWLIVLSSMCWLAIYFSHNPPWKERTPIKSLPGDFLAVGGQLVAEPVEGVGSYMAVLGVESHKELHVNRMWQGTDQKNHQTTAAHIPMLFHANPRTVLVVGLGTGQTARSFLTHPIEKLDIVEIEQGLVNLVVEHFDGASWLGREEVEMIIDDGRNFISHTSRKYDVISLEVGQVFRPGVATFYTREFYQQTRQRLTPKGVVCQFVPLNFLSRDDFLSVVGTFGEIFPQSVLWYNTSELLLVGTNADRIEIPEARIEFLGTEAIQQDLDFAYWGGGRQYLQKKHVFLGGFLCGPGDLKKMTAGAAIYVDDRPLLEYLHVRDLEYHRPVVELIEDHLTPLTEILEKPLSTAVVASSHRVRRDNLRSILTDQYLEAGNRLFESGDPRGGIAVLSYGLSLLPNHARANSDLGERYLQTGQMRKGINFFLRAVNIDNDLGSIHSNLGSLYVQMNQPARAKLHMEEALRVSPNDRQTMLILADLLSTNPDVSIRDGERAFQLVSILMQQGGDADWQVLITATAAMAVNGDFESAVQACEQALPIVAGNLEMEQNIRLRINRYKNKKLFLMAPAPVGAPGPAAIPPAGGAPSAPPGGGAPGPLQP
jgi:spermidine synthase